MIQGLFTILVKPLVGSGIGRIKFLANIYQGVSKVIMPKEKIVDIQGFRIKVIQDGHINDISTELIYKGIHEPASTQIFKRLIKEGNCVVDIGANVGYFTLLASRLVGYMGRVFSFEPDTMNMMALRENVELNSFQGIVRTKLYAVSDYNGRDKFFLSKDECARHSLIESVEHNATTMVDVIKLDDVIPVTLPVHFLKSDTEGNELAVLRGAKETINRNKDIKILVEVYPEAMGHVGVSVADLWGFIYRELIMHNIYLVDDYKNKIFSVSNPQEVLEYCKKSGLGCNLLCAREELTI